MKKSEAGHTSVSASQGPRPAPGMLEVNVATLAEVEPTLEDAIQSVSPAAVHYGMGILITRIGVGRYVVRAHPHVPEGFVRRQ
ncbi:hypothetical protein [Pseudarthrobacter sp. LT1]|uniref:hypothetical protein n=1 Tax=Pseudarthrobacter sp. LT1 TaxID=3111450 RepID=UPI002D79F394|nr:hypothetical protein [Pseudarthrobacter sp. LT1]WRT15719.1 hypothetical protein VIK36_09660 [Pseudarthrobacter sp. LT1]